MIDPLTLTATIVALTTKFVSLSMRCRDIWQNNQHATITLKAISTKCTAVKHFLDCFKHLLDKPQNANHITQLELPNWIESVCVVVDGCRIVYEVIEVEIQKFGPVGKKIRKRQRVRLLLNEKHLQGLLQLLRSQTESLESLLQILQTSLHFQSVEGSPGGRNECKNQHAQLQKSLLRSDSTIQTLLKKRRSAERQVREDGCLDDFDGNVIKRYSSSIQSIRDSIYSTNQSVRSIDEKVLEESDGVCVLSAASPSMPLLSNSAKVGIDGSSVVGLTSPVDEDLESEVEKGSYNTEDDISSEEDGSYDENDSEWEEDSTEGSEPYPETHVQHQPWAPIPVMDSWTGLGADPPRDGSYSSETLAKVLEPPPETEIVHRPWASLLSSSSSSTRPEAWNSPSDEDGSDLSEDSKATMESPTKTDNGRHPWASCSMADIWKDLGVEPPQATKLDDDSSSCDEDVV